MAGHAAKSLGERLGVAVRTARADFGAAADGIPRRVGPFDLGVGAHSVSPLLTYILVDFCSIRRDRFFGRYYCFADSNWHYPVLSSALPCLNSIAVVFAAKKNPSLRAVRLP